MIHGLCMPALIYLIYATTRIILDVYKGLYNAAFVQVWVALLFTYLLNILCKSGLGIVSWLIVSIPFILMSTIAAILLFVFGLNPATGKAMYAPQVQFATTISSAESGHMNATTTTDLYKPATASPTDATASTTDLYDPPLQQETNVGLPTRANYTGSPLTVHVESFEGILGQSVRPNMF